jgi:glycosyltransferase involved in cell wall biosynthesis
MKVLIITPFSNGGIGRYTANLSNALQNSEIEVTVVLTDRQVEYLGDELTRLKDKVQYKKWKSSKFIYAFPKILSALIANKYDHVIVNNLRLCIFCIFAKSLLPLKFSVSLVLHTTYSKIVSQLNPKKKSRTIYKLKKYLPKCQSVIAVSDFVAQDIEVLLNRRLSNMVRIYNPVITEELFRLSEKDSGSEFLSNNDPMLLGIGRLEKTKGFDVLIDAFEIVRESVSARLLIIGDGQDKKLLEDRISKSKYHNDMKISGFMSNPYYLLKNSKLFVLPSLWEGLPTTLIEAISLGIPVVASDCPGGVREILKNGDLGLIVEPGSVKALAEAIIKSLTNTEINPNIDKSVEPFKDSVVAQEYIRHLSSL